jgi:hypothetical protein
MYLGYGWHWIHCEKLASVRYTRPWAVEKGQLGNWSYTKEVLQREHIIDVHKPTLNPWIIYA